ncbi:MAG: hypothetical protein JWM33_3665 [Caulobacteraceae bacterium]|nr:hypothetical protein [Caulobacteraceae bacterium]
MSTGILQWYDPRRGRGAIALDGGGELFVKLCPVETARAIDLREGESVRFKSAMCEGLGRHVAITLAALGSAPRKAKAA